jgi:glycosyltransferase involved in cell wall biosynthesis
MVILELNFEKSWRGGERQTLYNMQGFRNAGISTHLICRKNSAMESRAIQEGFAVHSFGSVFGVISFLISKGKNYDCIHAQTSHILTYCVFTKWFHRRKVIFTRRVNFTPKGFFTKLKYSLTDKVVVISSEIENTITNFCGRTDIEIISDIVVKQTTDETKAKEMIFEYRGKHIAGTTSAFTEEKDPFTMLEAVKKLSQKRNDFVFLHFGDGVLMEEIRKKIIEYKLSDVYQLMGFSDTVHDLLPSFEVFVMTSTQEGLGSSVLDAFINKVPVVSTNAGGLKELLQNERGILCNIGDSNAIAEGINTFLNDAAKKETCVNNAFDYVQHNHSMDHITQQYISLIKK